MSPGIQSIAQRSAEEAVPPSDPFQAAVAIDIVEPGTGFVRAMVVNRRYTESPQPGNTKVNLAIGGSSGFQGGSTFKAFVLADAIRQGIPTSFTLYAPQKYTSKVFDKCAGCGPYEPQNAGDSESGTFDLVRATHDSVNTYFVQLEERLSIDKQVESAASLAESMGVKQFAGGRPSAPLNRGGSFVLGGNEVSPLDLASAYATFAARGLYCPARPVVEILDSAGQQIELPAQQCNQVLEQPVADTVNQILSGVIDGNTPGRTGRAASIGRPAAGKTGTTNGSRAAWFVGYTPQLATAVWMGDPGGVPGQLIKEMRRVTINGRYYPQVYGGSIPAPIWASTMRGALEGIPAVDFAAPDRSATQGQKVDVPDVSGLPILVAEEKLIEAGFSVRDGGRVSAAPIARGSAAYTLPRAGANRQFGSTVTLFESNGRFRRAATSAPQVTSPTPSQPADQAPPRQGPPKDKGKG